MGLVLQVEAYKGIVALIVTCAPCKSLYPHIGGDFDVLAVICLKALAVPESVVMSRIVRLGAVDVDETLYAVLFALGKEYVEKLLTVDHASVLLDKINVERIAGVIVGIDALYGIGVADHPVIEKLRRNRKSQDIYAVVGNFSYHIVDIAAPEIVGRVLGTVEAEPVGACEPYFVSVHVVETAALCVEPVVTVCVNGISRHH